LFAEDGLVETQGSNSVAAAVAAARAAQVRWAARPIHQRLAVIRGLRQEAASAAEALAATVPLQLPGSLHRSVADTLAAEVLPLLEACRFLEREAEFLLAPRQESPASRPLWLGGVRVETRREPVGLVLILGPGNYPLFLPGVQVLQALVAGNAVLWKPAPGCAAPAHALDRMLAACGLDSALVTVLGTDVETATAAIRLGVDKVILTGSAMTGRAVMRELAETLTPSVMELSGCDAVFALDGAAIERAVEAITFALRLNGSATCMAPRRLFVTDSVAEELTARLAASLGAIGPVPVPEATRRLLRDLVDEATLYGAHVVLDGLDCAREDEGRVYTSLLTGVTPDMRITQTDIFAPLLSVLRVEDEDAAVAAYSACPYALTAAIFAPARQAEALASRLRAGTVLINDVIVPTADPRASFGGRGQSGFGATRGREGLLEMTVPKTILRQASRSRRAFQPTGALHIPFFAGLAQALYAGGLRKRLAGVKKLIASARQIK
jgi:aldehyde dehydrogenase (NAD+)